MFCSGKCETKIILSQNKPVGDIGDERQTTTRPWRADTALPAKWFLTVNKYRMVPKSTQSKLNYSHSV